MLKGTLIGNLGRDAELKMIGNAQYAVFNVAHSERRTDKNGQPQEITTWVRCMKRDNDARLCPNLIKGKKVYVDGKLSIGSYVTQQGESRYELSIWVDNLEFLDRKSDGQQMQHPQPMSQGQALQQQWQQAQQMQQMGQQGQQPMSYRAPGYVPPQPPQQTGNDQLPF